MSQPTTLDHQFPAARSFHLGPRHAAPGVHAPTPDKTDGPSVFSFVLALLGLVVPLVSLFAILFGIAGAGRTTRRGTRGRRLAAAGITLGVIELAITAAVALGVWWVWGAYGDDLKEGLDTVSSMSEQYADLSAQVDEVSQGNLGAAVTLAKEIGPSGLAHMAADATELQRLAGDCQQGDTSACSTLLDRLPEGVVDKAAVDKAVTDKAVTDKAVVNKDKAAAAKAVPTASAAPKG